MASKSIAVSVLKALVFGPRRNRFVSFHQDIQHQGKFFIEPSSSGGKLNTSDWPLLLKVRVEREIGEDSRDAYAFSLEFRSLKHSIESLYAWVDSFVAFPWMTWSLSCVAIAEGCSPLQRPIDDYVKWVIEKQKASRRSSIYVAQIWFYQFGQTSKSIVAWSRCLGQAYLVQSIARIEDRPFRNVGS